MKIPTRTQAESLLEEAAQLNPGPWVEHNRVAAQCAQSIAPRHPTLDAEAAYILGLLHDIGRRFGPCDLMHILHGYRIMESLGYTDSARICLTHSFPLHKVDEYNGEAERVFRINVA